MRHRLTVCALVGLAVPLTMGSCSSPNFAGMCPIPENATAAERQSALAHCNPPEVSPEQILRRDVDILFVIDNSPAMAPKQKALAQDIPKFLQRIEATHANYHIGIATSDIGTDTFPGIIWGGGLGKCDTFAGDDGMLQAAACTTRTDVSPDAQAACSTLCPDPKYVPQNGQRFISKVDGITNVPVAMARDVMTGQLIDQGPSKAFQCMALVGDSGCSVAAPLEGSRRALDGHLGENSGFLRSDSVLAVIYITDEDDCSVQFSQRNQNDPRTRNCDPTQPDAADCYNLAYRCLARSIQCRESLLTPGVKTGCTERPDSYLDPITKYYTFFSKLRPSDKLLISGIWTLPSIVSGGRVEIIQRQNTSGSAQLDRASGTGASCSYSGDANIFGQAQLRLSKFAAMFGKNSSGTANALEVSICDIDNYPNALDKIAAAIADKLDRSLPSTPKTHHGQTGG